VTTRRRLAFGLIPVAIAIALLVARPGETAPGDSLVRYQPDETTIEACADSVPCLRQAYANLTYRDGAEKALRRLADEMAADTFILASCHQISHWMGAAGLLRANGEVSAAFLAGDETCGAGYWHGIMQTKIGSLIDTGDGSIVDSIDSLCADEIFRTSPWIAWQCVHGIGHGLLISLDYAVPTAIAECERLSRAWDVNTCTNGVFMENLIPSVPEAVRPWVSTEDPEFPCDRVPERHKNSCYQYAADQVIKLSGGLTPTSGKRCLSFDTQWIDACVDGYGRVVGASAAYLVSDIGTLCAQFGDEYRGVCVSGAAIDSLQNAPAMVERAGGICESLLDGAPACWERLGGLIGLLSETEEEVVAPCRIALSDISRDRCVRAALASRASY
jgi:hypothetical protein